MKGTVGIVGAGPAGLAMAKACKKVGLNYVKSALFTNYYETDTFKSFLLETRLSLLKV
ncbi:thioredoxin reductase [Leptospira ryugenii]|uniref:Thioredoxin reductase n=1 Tax=Leptospira ryugenii TaxID=1917863 RepID=A0A2P2E078_9LEPT|nr:hypothetical protein [Leptospira ryugenii]GBF50297.1 thioredoxin reductase [Leptospira ryugenii]